MDSRKKHFPQNSAEMWYSEQQVVMAGFKVSTLQTIEEEDGLGIIWSHFIRSFVSAASIVPPIEPSSFESRICCFELSHPLLTLFIQLICPVYYGD